MSGLWRYEDENDECSFSFSDNFKNVEESFVIALLALIVLKEKSKSIKTHTKKTEKC